MPFRVYKQIIKEGLNTVDISKFSSGDGVTEIKMSIFDRWGKEVFYSKDTSKGWNGKFGNADCEKGAYTYKIDYKVLSGNRYSEAGHVTLLRN